MKTKNIILMGAATVTMIAAVAGYNTVNSGFEVSEPTSLYVDADDNIDSLKRKLTETCHPDNSFILDINLRLFNLDRHMRTGHYVIQPGMSMMKAVRNVRNHSQTPVRLVVPSVRTVADMAQRLSKQVMADSAAIMQALTDETVVKDLGYTNETLPCLFIPNTYEVYWDVKVNDLLSRLKKENEVFWNEERRHKLAEVSSYAGEEMTIEKVVTLASIVDSETANNSEKPAIAALYMNRLRIGMPLQSDPTVKFALQDFALRRILHKHLEVDSPYNTYKNKGLPPGPICVPSIAGIDAVLNHANHEYIYMCAKEDFSGTHNFAVGYAEHQRNAARYAAALNKRNIH